MNKVKKSFDLLSEKQRKVAIEKIIDYFATERDEEIGVIAAEDILDMFLNSIGPHLFNAGVKESKKVIETYFQEINFNMEMLLKEDNQKKG